LKCRCPQFYESFKEKQIVELSGISSTLFLSFLNWVYSNELPEDSLLLSGLIAWADRWNINKLNQACNKSCKTNLHMEEDMKLALECEDLCDIWLTTEAGTLAAHKVILAFRSQYFTSMFHSGMKESLEKNIRLEGIELETLKIVKEFSYTGNPGNVLPNDAMEVVCVAAHILDSR